MAFIRLTNDQYIGKYSFSFFSSKLQIFKLISFVLDHFFDYQIKVRFMFIFLGPKKSNIDYHEVGRCMGTMMTDSDFVEYAYSAKKRQDLIRGISQFCSKCFCIAMPLGQFDEDLLNPIINWTRYKMDSKMNRLNIKRTRSRANYTDMNNTNYNRNSKILDKISSNNSRAIENKKITKENKKGELNAKTKANKAEFDPFKRTGSPFGTLRKEIYKRYSNYFSDIRDGLNMNCLISFIFIFTVCIAPALCFGGILADKTDNWFGINEILIATSLNGIIFGLLSGQPLLIFGATGPFLVFEEMVYKVLKSFLIYYRNHLF
jgi:hypothetical protein